MQTLWHHGLETFLVIIALISAIMFVVFHVFFTNPTNQGLWLLALATILLATSDLIMRWRK